MKKKRKIGLKKTKSWKKNLERCKKKKVCVL